MKPKATIAWTYLDVYGFPCVKCFHTREDAAKYFGDFLLVVANQQPVKVRITVMPDRKKGKK